MLFIVLSSLLHLRLVLTASSPLQSCRFLVWLDPFHACLSNVSCLGHQSQHFQGLRGVLACFWILLSRLDNCLAIPFLHPKKGIIEIFLPRNFYVSIIPPLKGHYSIIAARQFPTFLANCSSFVPDSICSFPTLFSRFLLLRDILSFLDVPLLASIHSLFPFPFLLALISFWVISA